MRQLVLDSGPGWLAIDKPSGMSVHNDPEGKADAISFAAQALTENRELARRCQIDPGFHPAPVHRLDRETSGVLLLATRKDSASLLAEAFQERRTEKIYRAVVRGILEGSGHWQAPLTDRAEGRKNPQGASRDRKDCATSYNVLRTNAHLSELEIALGTGRQHQIRRHAVLARHEVLGDSRYGDPKFNARMENLFGLRRLLLHAHRLRLELRGTEIVLEAPIPLEFALVFEPPGSPA